MKAATATVSASPPWRGHSNHDDALVSLLQTEVILPTQYGSDRERDERSEPARRLLLAVLEDALITLLRHQGRRAAASRRLVAETESWIESDRRTSPFDFVALCDVLSLDPAYIRNLLWRTRGTPDLSVIRRRAHAGRGHHKVRAVGRRRRSRSAAAR